MGPLGKVAKQRKQWLANVTAYTLAGALASGLVGVLLGSLGALLGLNEVIWLGIGAAILVSIAVIARELGWVRFRLPQVRRQTSDLWAKVFPSPLVSALWGFDLGLIFTTWLTFGGAWLLALVALVSGDPTFGAGILIAHWFGRALSVWVAPLLLPLPNAGPRVLQELAAEYPLFRRIHLLGLALATVVLVAWLSLVLSAQLVVPSYS